MIRPLEPADRAAWQPLWDRYLRFYRHTLDPGVTDDVFARLAAGEDDLHGFVAEADDGALVGIAHVVVHPSTWTADRYVYLEDLFVASAARGAGVGRALIEHVYAFAGDRHVYWQTQADNATARSLYDAIGVDSGAVVYERPSG